jgi:hypothetical protein
VRGLIVGTVVGLQLDDPADSPAVRIVTDEMRPQQCPGRFERWPGQDRAVDDALAQ